ncbi:MAG: WYL domain-containing protein [Coriobacteriales bacterium]|nr:WYL domain-containing protein [Coriobacteriales bacterium]
MARVRSQRSGRKNNNDLIRELISLLGSLSRTGDSVSLDAISSRLGIGIDEARSMMNIVCQASGEEIGGLLISSNEDETEFTLQYPGTSGKPIRLTTAETIALNHAMDVAGIEEHDPLRERVSTAFSSPEVDIDEVRHALGTAHDELEPLIACAQSQVEHREMSFLYRGIRDAEPRQRRALVLGLKTESNIWYVNALDTELDQQRTFRVDRMAAVSLGAVLDEALPHEPSPDAQQVRITFTDMTYYSAFDWPTLQVIRETNDSITGSITYYGSDSTWLLRRICAGNGSVNVDDERIMRRAREYALHQLIDTGNYA